MLSVVLSSLWFHHDTYPHFLPAYAACFYFNSAIIFICIADLTTFLPAAPIFFSFFGSSTFGMAFCTSLKKDTKNSMNLSDLALISSAFLIMSISQTSVYFAITYFYLC